MKPARSAADIWAERIARVIEKILVMAFCVAVAAFFDAPTWVPITWILLFHVLIRQGDILDELRANREAGQ